MIQKDFAYKVIDSIKEDPGVIGLAAGGSWITDELDEFSDLDLLLITGEKIAGDKEKMLAYANRFGDLISGFTGEHVGEPRVLICLYDQPLLHVDIKFLTLAEFYSRVENPVVLFERDNQLTAVINTIRAGWPQLDFQWIEDRFWTWVHYACLKIGRGELFEAVDFLSFLRMTVLSPLLQVKNNRQPRGLRKVEMQLSLPDLENLKNTIPQYNHASIIKALKNAVDLYTSLQTDLYPDTVHLQKKAERRSLAYLEQIKAL
ncbi:MAG: nucleotidyltransferase domain-containing protein [Ferruginibacter sp.]|nr:nucleotidyltransferase domain-containing protein [Chitinophagaceae bacterium]